MKKYVFYGIDCETTGFATSCDVIELSLYRLSDDAQQTWLLKPLNIESIQPDALRVNGHKLEDLKHQTKYGIESYKDPNKIIVEIENWLAEDDSTAANRCLIGHNVPFDKDMIINLWNKCNASDSFPFGRRYLDTMQIALMTDFIQNSIDENHSLDVGYSLHQLSKKYSIKNEKEHSAAADIKCTIEIFKKQIDYFQSLLNK